MLSSPAAAALASKDPLFRIDGVRPLSFAADPVTGHLYADGNGRIDEYTPWGEFVRALGTDVAPGAVNEQQELRVRASGGTFKLTFDAFTTPDLPFDATATEVQSALNALPSIAGANGSVVVQEHPGTTDGTTPFIYVATFKGDLAGTDVGQITAENGAQALGGGDPATELEVRTRANGTPGGGGLESCTAESGCQGGSGGSRGGQINGVSSVAIGPNGDIYLGESGRIQELTPTGEFVRAWGGDVIRDGASGTGTVSPGSSTVSSVVTKEKAFLIGQPIEGTGIEPGTTIADDTGENTIVLSQPAGPTATGATTNLTVPPGPNNVPVNEVQTVSLDADTTGGTFGLEFSIPRPVFNHQLTEPIPFNASAAEVQSALAGLSILGAGNVSVTSPNPGGGAAPGGPYSIEFKGTRFADSDVQPMRLNLNGIKVSSNFPHGSVTSETAEETCEVAAECQAGEGNGYRLAFAPGGATLYAGNAQRIRRFSPTGADLGDLPDPEGLLQGGKIVRGLVADPESGRLYLAVGTQNGFGSEENIRVLDGSNAKVVGERVAQQPNALTVDGEGDLFAIDAAKQSSNHNRWPHVAEFDSAGKQLLPDQGEEAACEKLEEDSEEICDLFASPKQPLSGFGLIGIGSGPGGDLYVTNVSLEHSFVQAYGPPPLGLESPPAAAPTIERQFAVSADTTGAELRAKINPHFFSGTLGSTNYYVQYGLASCVETDPGEYDWEAPCVQKSSTPPGPRLRSGVVDEAVPVSTFLSGLVPASAYRYRFVAESSGAPGQPVFAPAGAFATVSLPGEEPPCPQNQAYRVGRSAALPDCRAYELVSPLDKGGGDIVSVTGTEYTIFNESSLSGGRLAYGTYKSFGDAQAAPWSTQYIAARGPGGWQSHAISPPRPRSLFRPDSEFWAFSPDLCQSWVKPLAELSVDPAAIPFHLNIYRRTDSECGGPSYEAVTKNEGPTEPEPSAKFEELVQRVVELQGLSADGSKAFLAAADQLTADAPPARELVPQVYESSGGKMHYVCILPSGKPTLEDCTLGHRNTLAWVGPTSTALTSEFYNAVSADGERLFWSPFNGGNAGPIYLRQHPDRPQSAFAHGSASGKGRVEAGKKTITALVSAEGTAALSEGSETVVLGKTMVGEFLVGQPLSGEGIPAGTEIVSITANTLTLSKKVEAGKSNPEATIRSSGPAPFEAGQTISGPGIPFGTTVKSVGPGTLTISEAATVTKSGTPLNATSQCTEPEKACTITVSEAAEIESGNEHPHYRTASNDGSVVIFTAGADLHEARIEEDAKGHLLAKDSLISHKVVGYMGASEDASRIYFASQEVLTAEANPQGKSPIPGKSNLYLYDAAKNGEGRFAFVGTLGGGTEGLERALTPAPRSRLTRVSPDGLHAAFDSLAPLTGYDNTDVQSGEADAEVFVYDASANGGGGKLACASCNPSGARPKGTVVDAEGYTAVGSVRAAAIIPGANDGLYATRPLSEDGKRLFFNSYDALLPRDTNGAADVYEWEALGAGSCSEASSSYRASNGGCLFLISSGTSPAGSRFLDADPEGKNVFFLTLASLLPQDPGLVDVYDARIDGGLPSPVAPVSCEGEACQSPPTPPDDPTPASSSFEGAGNVQKEATQKKHKKKSKKQKHKKAKAKHRAAAKGRAGR